MSHPHLSARRAALLTAAASFAVVTAPAATLTWDGGDSLWQTPATWVGDIAPVAGDALMFAGTTNLASQNDFPANTAFLGLTFNAGAGSFNISGNGIVLNRTASTGTAAGLTGGNITNNSTSPQTVGIPLTLSSGNHSIATATGSGQLNLAGTFTRTSNATLVFTKAGGEINFTDSGLANNTSGILGSWAVIGDNWASLDVGGNVVPYNGYTGIATGAITGGATLNYRHTGDSGNLTAANGTTINSFTANTGAARTLAITGTMKLGSRGGIYRNSTSNGVTLVSGGLLTANGGGEITLLDATGTAGFAATNNNLRIDSVISNDGLSVVSVNIVGYLDIRGANTYSGGTFINQGRVQTGNLAAFGTGPVTVYPGGQAFLNNGGNWPNAFTVTGNGPSESNGGITGPGAIRLGTTSNITNTLTLAGNARITSSNQNSPGATISGRITGDGALELGGFANSGAILNLSNTGTPNDWNGPLTIAALSSQRVFNLKLGASEQIPNASNVTVTGATTVTWDLNGFNETIGGLNSAASANFTVTNLAAAGANSTLTVGTGDANGDYGGKLQDVLGGGTLSLVKNGTGKQVLRGSTAYLGTTTINGGTLEAVGDILADGLITVNSGATFAANGLVSGDITVADGGKLHATGLNEDTMDLEGALSLGTGTTIDLGTAPLPAITVAGAITTSGGAGSVVVNLDPADAKPAVGQHSLISYGSLGGTGISAFTLGTIPQRFAATLVNDTVNNAIALNVTTSDHAVWSGALGSEWSTATLDAPKNWVLSSTPGTSTDFLSGESVEFNDAAVATTVDTSGANVPAGTVNFANSTKDYLLTGTHAISSTGSLIKGGTGTVAIASEGHVFAGGITINEGTLQVGNAGTTGNLGSNAVVNHSSLEFNRSDDTTVANVISGTGTVKQEGSGILTLSGTNTYDGATIIASSTLRVTNNASLGAVPGGDVTIQAGAALDISGNPTVNNANFGAKLIHLSGNGPSGAGALVNAGTVNQQAAFQQLVLDADASIGGTGRFDIRNNAPKLDLNGFTLRKRGTNQFTVVGGTVTGGGQIIVEGGGFAIETTSGMDEPSGTVTFEAGTMAMFYQNNLDNGGVDWPLTLREGVTLGNAGAALATVPAAIVLEGNVQLVGYNAGLPAPEFNRPLTLTGNITENGGSYSIAKNGISVVALSGAASTYTGATLVNAGTLNVNGTVTSSPFTVASGATLGGTGTVGGTLAADGIVSPGVGGIGTLATGATTFSGTGSLVAEINSTAIATDKLVVTGSLNLGGALLTVTDLGASVLPVGTKFVVASYTGAQVGAFSNAPDNGTLVVGLNTFKIDYDEDVSGTLSVTLTVPPDSAYDEWATTKGLDGSNNGKLQDPDHDGRENVIEFGLDGNPLSGVADGKTRVAIADVDPGAGVENAVTLTLPVRTGADFDGPGDLVSGVIDEIIYKIQGSANLSDFTSLDVTEVTPALDADLPGLSTGWSYRTFRLPGTPGSPHAKAFLRADVEAP